MPRSRWTGRKAALLLGVALIAAGLGTLAHAEHFLRRPEQETIDARYQIRGTDRRKVADFVLVSIDAATKDDFRKQHIPAAWPFPRGYFARVIEHLHQARARVIAVDVDFEERREETERKIEEEEELEEAVEHARDVVLGADAVGVRVRGATTVLGGDAFLHKAHARAGEVELRTDSDGVLRKMQDEIGGLKTFGVAVAEVATGRPLPASSFGGATNPTPIDYAGPAGTVPSISFSDVYDGRFRPGTFAGKIVIVGASAPSLNDLHQTATGSVPMTGSEIWANEAATALSGIPLREPAAWVTVFLIVGLALLPACAGLRLGTLGVALYGAGILILWALATQLAFNSGSVLDFSDPAAALMLATGGSVLVGLREDSRERARLRNLFAADSTAVVDEVLHQRRPGGLEPTAIIAGYRIEAPIARGGMGVVYRATQLELDRPVALKLIATEHAQDPTFRARFTHESRLAASIEHVNVIPVYEAGEDDGLLFIAMRLVEGTDLAQLLDRVGALEPRRTARLVEQLARGLDAAHAHGLVHRDVKPANALLTLDQPEHLYLTDFGVAKHIDGGSGLTEAGLLVGTLDYLAPERIRGEAVGPGVDIYALACLLYHCLTGEVPFPREDAAAKLWAQINAPPPAPSRLVRSLPSVLDEVIARGMAKDPRARYASAGELARACVLALGLGIELDPASPPPKSEADPPRVPTPPTEISQ
jgi:CHASE2 domain-containing sensor protein